MYANNRISWIVVTSFLLGAGSLIAQDLIPKLEKPSQFLIGQPSSIGMERALGRDTKGVAKGGGAYFNVVFDGGGMTFTPALGKDAEHLHPLRFSFESIRRGNTTVFAATEDPRAQLNGYVASYARGDITERFEVKSEGVEFSYLFPRHVPGTGDLVVRCRLTTDLEMQLRGTNRDPIRLTAEHVGGVQIGSVTGIGADGRREPGSLRFDGKFLELVLPSAFVDSAVYPLLLDPLVGTTLNAGSATFDDEDADVAYESTQDEYLICWTRTFSIKSIQIRAQRVNGTTSAKIGGFLAITTAGGINKSPSVGTVATTDRFLIAWQTGSSAFGPWDISCRGVDAGSGSMSAIVPVANTAANETAPDVGGERRTDNDALVVWSDDSLGIRGAQVTLASNVVAPLVFGKVTIFGSNNATNPRISKSGGSFGRYLVVFDFAGATAAIYGKCVDRNLLPIGPVLFIAVDVTLAEASADVDGNGADFVCVWSETESGLSGDRDIYCRRITCDGVTASVLASKIAIESDPNDDERDPAIAYLGPKYVVTWTDEAPGFLSSDVTGISLDPTSCLRCGHKFQIAGTRAFEANSQIASEWAGGANRDNAVLVCSSYDRTLSFKGDVIAQRFSAIGAGGAVVSVGGNCGLGGTASITGAFAIANRPRILLKGTAGTIGALNIGIPNAFFTCGPCDVMRPIVSLPATIAGGKSSYAFNIPCTALFLVGKNFEFQYISGLTGVTPCQLAPTVSISNRIQATFGF